MATPDGPMCSDCGGWMLPYSGHVDAPLACVNCDLITPVIIPRYATVPPPSIAALSDESDEPMERDP